MTRILKGTLQLNKGTYPDIRSVELFITKHDKTGAEVLKNEDDNKAFNIAFRTPPYDK